MDSNIHSKCFVKEDNFVAREISGETIVVPVRSRAVDLDSVYTFNELGTVIWKLLDRKTTVGEIIEAVTRSYAVTEEAATKDVVDFLSSLEAAGFIHSPME